MATKEPASPDDLLSDPLLRDAPTEAEPAGGFAPKSAGQTVTSPSRTIAPQRRSAGRIAGDPADADFNLGFRPALLARPSSK